MPTLPINLSCYRGKWAYDMNLYAYCIYDYYWLLLFFITNYKLSVKKMFNINIKWNQSIKLYVLQHIFLIDFKKIFPLLRSTKGLTHFPSVLNWEQWPLIQLEAGDSLHYVNWEGQSLKLSKFWRFSQIVCCLNRNNVLL